MNDSLVIRADASTEIGTGHVMRCLALAQSWRHAGGDVLFVFVSSVPALDSRLKAEGLEVAHISSVAGSADEARQTLALANDRGATWVVVDGYQFNAQYQRVIKQGGLHLLLVDDYGQASSYSADLILNQNIIRADESLYLDRAPNTRLLLGTRYALLRREFWSWRDRGHDTPRMARKVLVTLGGSDPDNVTLTVIQALQRIEMDGLESIVIIGYANPHAEALAAAIRTAGANIRLVSRAENMPEMMAWADVAISSAGSTTWEFAFMGVPIVSIVLAENQSGVAQGLAEAGAAVNLGWFDRVSEAQIAGALENLILAEAKRLHMTQLGQQLVDGRGAFRVLERLRSEAS